MKLAVVVPTCDRPEMLPRALTSVTAQTLQPDEIIVVDDGGSAVRMAGTRRVPVGPHSGPSAARNAGVRATDADVVCFLDDDDEWEATYLARVAALLKDHDLVLTAFQKVRSDGSSTAEKIPPPTLDAGDWLVKNRGLRGSNLAIRRSVFWELGGFDEILSCGEDMDLAIRAAEAGVSYARLELPLVRYHAHSGPRITMGGRRHRAAHRTWLAAQGNRLDPVEVRAYRERTRQLFGEDPGPLPRLIWVLGPPGAGKTSWALHRAGPLDRVMDVEDVCFWLDGADLGVQTAKRHLVQMVRSVECSQGVDRRRFFVTAAYLDPEDLGELTDVEHVVAVVPDRATWESRIEARDGSSDAHAEEYARWAERWGVGAAASDNVGLAAAE